MLQFDNIEVDGNPYKCTAIHVGRLATFYLPLHKMEMLEYGRDDMTPDQVIKAFLMENFNAYTFEESNIHGVWRDDMDGEIFHDKNVRFEVSFSESGKLPLLQKFLAEVCVLLKEKCVYVTIGQDSWLIRPERICNEI